MTAQRHFVHLRLHTEYSISDGLLRISSLMEKAAACGMPAIAITDLNNLCGVVKFYRAAIQVGIKPLIGADLYLVDDHDPKKKFRLTLLCQTNEGYQNLLKLISRSYLEGQVSGKPMLQKAWLSSLTHGLIALSGAQEGDIGQALLANDPHSAKTRLNFWKAQFPERFYLEISRVGKADEPIYIPALLSLAESNAVPIIATNEVCFLEPDDFEAHEARVCVQEGTTLNDPNRSRFHTDQQYFRTSKEMQQLFADLPEALENTVEIAKRCNVTIDLSQHQLPHFSVPEGTVTESYLSELATQGLEKRLANLFSTPTETLAVQRRPYDQRLLRELDVINKMGFAGYFLIVADFTRWAKENGIPVGPGRGSGPGSLVAYALNITDLNPLAHDLLFERFLNPERVSMPDFDIDFCIDGRDRVIDYVMQKHGRDRVAQIITYGTMAAKAVVRDVGRVQALPYGFVDKIAKLIPFEIGMTLEQAMKQEPLLRERYEQEEDVRTLIDLARKLEGITRNIGRHAGGIVIAPGQLINFVPLYCEPNESMHPVTQFDKDDVEAVGLVKFDFLGLKTLTIIDRALRVINAERAKQNEPPIDISLLPLHDEKTFTLLKACQSTAIFQLESSGMRDLIKRLQPDCFEDLIALVALFRPGPLQSGMVDDFINRKYGRAKVLYPHPQLEPILRPTYGVILYQEQVMQIAQILAGYTLGAADILRHAMGKKKPGEMAKQRKIFCKGAVERGVNAELASHIFDLMEKFSGYGFNKSHSAAYALIAYQTAWLKAHYPAAFMAAVLSSDMDRTEKIMILLDECKSLQLHVAPPNINQSEASFIRSDDTHLLYGLGAIKGMGIAAIENILAARGAGSFHNLFDFCHRVDLRKVNRRALEALIKSGCFDTLQPSRATLMASLPRALQYAEQALHNQTVGQHDLLASENDNTPAYIEATAWSEEVRLQYEKETLGLYLTGHPLHAYLKEFEQLTTCHLSALDPHQHKTARVAGMIAAIRTRQTKRGDRMAIVTLDDSSALLDVVCFGECFQKYRTLINEDQLIIIEGDVNLDEFNHQPRLIARELYTLDQARDRFAKGVQLYVQTLHTMNFLEFYQILSTHQGGTCPITIHYLENNAEVRVNLGKNWLIKPHQTLLKALQALAIENVEIMY